MDSVIPVAVGGLIGILGGILTQLLTHRFGQTRERHKILREKGEAICVQVDVLVRWMGERRNKTFSLEQDTDMHPPFGMLVGLQALYFNDAAAEVQNLGIKATAFMNALSCAHKTLSKANLSVMIEEKMGRDPKKCKDCFYGN